MLVDTDIVSYYMKKILLVKQTWEQYLLAGNTIFISQISVLEVLNGLKAKNASTQLAHFNALLSNLTLLEISFQTLELASDLYAYLYQNGKHSGQYDLLIAATALEHHLPLCTNNIKDYQNFPNLILVNWTV